MEVPSAQAPKANPNTICIPGIPSLVVHCPSASLVVRTLDRCAYPITYIRWQEGPGSTAMELVWAPGCVWVCLCSAYYCTGRSEPSPSERATHSGAARAFHFTHTYPHAHSSSGRANFHWLMPPSQQRWRLISFGVCITMEI